MPQKCEPDCNTAPGIAVPHFAVGEALGIAHGGVIADMAAMATRLVTCIEEGGHNLGRRVARTSFFSVKDAAGKFTLERFTACGERFVTATEKRVVHRDAAPFMQQVQRGNIPHVFISQEDGTRWPLARVALGLRQLGASAAYVELADRRSLGGSLQRWRGPTGTFDFVGYNEDNQPAGVFHAAKAGLVASRGHSFSNLPYDCFGILIPRGDKEEIPHRDAEGRTRTVRSLGEVTLESSTGSAPSVDIAYFQPIYRPDVEIPGARITAQTNFADLPTLLA
jgi:hypothetical protein